MDAKDYLSGVYLDTKKFSKKEVIELMEDYHKYKTAYIQQVVKKSNTHVVSKFAKVEDRPKPLNWLLRYKLGIEKGTTYVEPKLTVRQCVSWIGEYVKKHCC